MAFGTFNFDAGRAAARNRVSGKWNLFNDDRVEELEPEEVQTSSAYVLFFTKVGLLPLALTPTLATLPLATLTLAYPHPRLPLLTRVLTLALAFPYPCVT